MLIIRVEFEQFAEVNFGIFSVTLFEVEVTDLVVGGDIIGFAFLKVFGIFVHQSDTFEEGINGSLVSLVVVLHEEHTCFGDDDGGVVGNFFKYFVNQFERLVDGGYACNRIGFGSSHVLVATGQHEAVVCGSIAFVNETLHCIGSLAIHFGFGVCA